MWRFCGGDYACIRPRDRVLGMPWCIPPETCRCSGSAQPEIGPSGIPEVLLVTGRQPGAGTGAAVVRGPDTPRRNRSPKPRACPLRAPIEGSNTDTHGHSQERRHDDDLRKHWSSGVQVTAFQSGGYSAPMSRWGKEAPEQRRSAASATRRDSNLVITLSGGQLTIGLEAELNPYACDLRLYQRPLSLKRYKRCSGHDRLVSEGDLNRWPMSSAAP
jgi:hypothetical protein